MVGTTIIRYNIIKILYGVWLEAFQCCKLIKVDDEANKEIMRKVLPLLLFYLLFLSMTIQRTVTRDMSW